MYKNSMEIKFKSLSINESFARVCVSAFCVQMSPTIEELEDIKTAVSEAVTNCIVHAYKNKIGIISIKCDIENDKLTINISDSGVGIKNIEKAREPFFTTEPSEERSGMGISVMESFMDEFDIKNNSAGGVTVIMSKYLREKIRKSAV